jgi:hypothetical protein
MITRNPWTRWLVVVVGGLALGALTSFGQTVLDPPWSSLANSASPWLAGAFAAGAIQPRLRPAVLAGLVACVLAVAGYYLTAAQRGYGASHTGILFWSVCAIAGGPVFGAAGHLWWSQRRAIGAALLPAVFLAEAVEVYWLSLHYRSDAYLYAVIAVGLGAVLSVRVSPRQRAGAWLAALTLLGIAGFYVVGQVATSAIA